MPHIPGYERTLLQIAVGTFGWVPVAAGAGGMVLGASFVENHAVDLSLDSHVRYLSGLLLAVGLGFWSTVPRIETKTRRFRLLTAMVMIGGLGRLGGIAVAGIPPMPMLFGLIMELGVTPILCIWQWRISAGFPKRPSDG